MATGREPNTRIVELLATAQDEDAAVAALDGCVSRLRRARAAQATLAQLDTVDLRAVLALRATHTIRGAR